jgi:hyaluronan synthase
MAFSIIVLFTLASVIYPAVFMIGSYFLRTYWPAGMRVNKDYSLEPTVSILMSCFNEGKAVYDTIKSIRASNYPVEKLQIIAFDDCSKDDSWEWMQKAAAECGNVLIRQNKANQGKALTVVDMAKESTSEFLVGVDSDGILDPNAIKELMVCFTDPKIGGVGGRFGITNVNDTFLTQCQTILYATSFYMFRPLENFLGAVQCLGGPLVAFRREVYLRIVPLLETRNFLGVKVTNGEDRIITQYLLAKGYRTLVNLDAKCLVSTPSTWGGYLNQQLRWRRSVLGQGFDMLTSLWMRIKGSSISIVTGSLLQVFALIAWNLFALFLIFSGKMFSFMVTLSVVHLVFSPVMGVIYNLCMRKNNSDQCVKNPILAPLAFVVWFPINIFIITIVALLTLDDGGWVTRQETPPGTP